MSHKPRSETVSSSESVALVFAVYLSLFVLAAAGLALLAVLAQLILDVRPTLARAAARVTLETEDELAARRRRREQPSAPGLPRSW